jgi:hypothetical protein
MCGKKSVWQKNRLAKIGPTMPNQPGTDRPDLKSCALASSASILTPQDAAALSMFFLIVA